MLDGKDAKILNLVQVNNRLTSEQIGDQIGLSHTGVVRRLKRLRETEVIVAEVALVSPERVGYSVRVNVSCVLDRDPPDTYDRFKNALRSHPNVISADMVMGESDFMFTVVARGMSEFSTIRDHLMAEFPSLRSFTCLGVLETVKRGPVPVQPLSEDETAI